MILLLSNPSSELHHVCTPSVHVLLKPFRLHELHTLIQHVLADGIPTQQQVIHRMPS